MTYHAKIGPDLDGNGKSGPVADADWLLTQPDGALIEMAAASRDAGHGSVVSYSRKVFIPLTQLCRDVCHYCTFAHPPRSGQRCYMTAEQVLEVARHGQKAGCKEALFTLGDKPELRYRAAREELQELKFSSTLEYLRSMARLVFEETGLLPHLNPGVLAPADIADLREVSVSMGIMLESGSRRLMEKGMCHHGSPDKDPSVRLETIAEAGRQRVPFTSGILIGIGETRRERIEALMSLQRLHEEFGHIQEIIVQNFRAKPGTRMANAPEPSVEELRWTIAIARLIFGPEMNIQAPPNLSQSAARQLIPAGINDWGGVSPLTPDFVNPEAPWPHLSSLAQDTAEAGKTLVERLAIYPAYALSGARWMTPKLHVATLKRIDATGFSRTDGWSPGGAAALPGPALELGLASGREVEGIITRAAAGDTLSEKEVSRLFAARAGEVDVLISEADSLRRKVNGDVVTYVVTRNINYTNICYFHCKFCAFSKGRTSESLRGQPYVLGNEEIVRRAREAWDRGATEVCLQGGIHPKYTGDTYIQIVRAIKSELPDLHIHAFSPLEIHQGAATLGVSLRRFLEILQREGLSTLPGTAAEILDDEVRSVLCPDKITTDQWIEVMSTAHELGLRSTVTIMFGHIERPVHWARHLLRVRALQERTGGFTELVPLPFVHMEAPMFMKGMARPGPTWREAILMHAISRLALNPVITNIQTSWPKLGPQGVAACLNAGANDLGGTLMNESITKAAGAGHGQEISPEQMEAIIAATGRTSRQRTTLYGRAPAERQAASYQAPTLAAV